MPIILKNPKSISRSKSPTRAQKKRRKNYEKAFKQSRALGIISPEDAWGGDEAQETTSILKNPRVQISGALIVAGLIGFWLGRKR